jgi:LmbE family N-acetylglucosaminyl deacetylase
MTITSVGAQPHAAPEAVSQGETPGKGAAQSKTLLAVFAHPDDEIVVAPLLSTYARRGVRVHLVVVTDGEKGVSPHAGIPAGPQLARTRADEARCSCRVLGIEAPTLLGFKDGEMGMIETPPWRHLSDIKVQIAKAIEEKRPDAIVTFGPDGGYGHPDHRLVGALVTELVQGGATGAPAILVYPGFPKERLANAPQTGFPWAPTDTRFLTIRVPYDAKDVAAARAALACHKSQFPEAQIEPLVQFMNGLLGGRVYLRPWIGATTTDDVFQVKIP